MGSVLANISKCTVGFCACCCGQETCRFWRSCQKSRSTRLLYSGLLFLVVLFCLILLAPGMQVRLQQIVPYCYPARNTSYNACDHGIVAFLGIYRAFFALCSFFVIFGIIMIDVKSSVDPRSWIQNGIWFPKLILLIVLTTGAFYIPADTQFEILLMYFGSVCSFMFTQIQLLFLVDFAYGLADSWMEKFEESGFRIYYCGIVVLTMLNYGLSIAGTVYMFIEYTRHVSCNLHRFLLAWNLLLCVISSIASIISKVQNAQPRSGLLQSSVVSIYATYLTWSAFISSPYTKCIPPDFKGDMRTASIVGILLSTAIIVYSVFRKSTSQVDLVLESEPSRAAEGSQKNDDEEIAFAGKPISGTTKAWDDEKTEVSYNWSFFHLMFAMASMYLMMNLTAWYVYEAKQDRAHPGSFWMKILSSWFVVILYLCTLVSPLYLPDREFE